MKERVIVSPGDRSGRLVAIECVRRKEGVYILCRCDCGKELEVYKGNYTSGRSLSCGCLRSDLLSKTKRTHGMSKSKEYRAWNNMLTRCYNPKSQRYHRYGGRGIRVCEQWVKSFQNFISDMGVAPTELHTIGRIDNDGNYCPENCRWELPEQQAANTSRSVRVQTDHGEMSAKEAAAFYGVTYGALIQRIQAGRSKSDLSKASLHLQIIEVDGVSGPTTYWMKEAGIPISSFYYHMRKGLTREQIVRKYLARNGNRTSRKEASR